MEWRPRLLPQRSHDAAFMGTAYCCNHQLSPRWLPAWVSAIWFPCSQACALSGSKTVTISPGALTGRFQTVGNMDPHTYNPNEFFSNNWLYEGLVSYGPDGTILPALAESWTITDTPSGGQQYSFKLRPSVKFHDGAEWNCQAAKMNLDHVLAGALVEPVWHGWYGVPKHIEDWKCAGDDDNDMELIMTTSTKFYPFLQELSFIRPLRFMSPNAFAEGANSDPYTANSCERGWGTLESETVSAVSGRAYRPVTSLHITQNHFPSHNIHAGGSFQRCMCWHC